MAKKKVANGPLAPPRKCGAMLYVTSGMSREAAQELGGWRSSEVMEDVYSKVRSGEVAPEMRMAAKRASERLGVDRFAQGLGESVTLVSEEKWACRDPYIAGRGMRIFCWNPRPWLSRIPTF